MRANIWSFICSAILAGAVFVDTSAQAQTSNQPPRWILADDVRVHTGPEAETDVTAKLNRGAELILKAPAEQNGYCFIEGEGAYGYVLCKYLSTKAVERSKAGVNGIDATQRWVTGNDVVVRTAPLRSAAIAGRLAVNMAVKLVQDKQDNGYCEIQATKDLHGFTACRYLATTPVVLAHVLGYQQAAEPSSPDYNPARAFWLDPSWEALTAYADFLEKSHPDIPEQGPWPRDETLERMKAHLALGLNGRKPTPFADWSELKHMAAQDLDLRNEAEQLARQGKHIPDDMWRANTHLESIGRKIGDALGLSDGGHDPNSTQGAASNIRLVRALDFPPVRLSLFHNYLELAPPSATTEEASGRFGIIFRQLITPRPKPKSADDPDAGAGLYDMLARTQLLVRPVHRVTLFRDGRLTIEPSFVRNHETLWYHVDEPECDGWEPGFGFGDADASIWKSLKSWGEAASNSNPSGSLYAFYTTVELPSARATLSMATIKLDRGATGFVEGTYLIYDLNGDGIPDLAVWEGKGIPDVGIDGPYDSDDHWYRLVLVNINGAWKILGSDSVGYSCGC